MDEPYPRWLLPDTLWDFAGQPSFRSRADFDAAVLRHLVAAGEDAPEIRAEECWRPGLVALRAPRVVVRYYCDPPDEEESWREVELSSDDGVSFTGGELLHKVHNAIVDRVRGNGHHWFEGLDFEGVTEAGVPVYCLIPGS